jgi:hypothetical protein
MKVTFTGYPFHKATISVLKLNNHSGNQSGCAGSERKQRTHRMILVLDHRARAFCVFKHETVK